MTPSPAGTGPGRFGAFELVLLATVSLVWGAAYVFIRQGLLLGAAPLAYAAVRYGLAAVAFAGLAAFRRQALPARGPWIASAVIGGLLIIGLYGGLLYWGEQYTTGGYAAVLASTVPLLTVGFGAVLLPAERLGIRGITGMAIGFGGAVVLVLPELLGSPLGSAEGPLFVLLAMISASAGTVLLRRYGGGPQGLWQIGTQFLVAGLLLGLAALVLPGQTALPGSPPLLLDLAALVGLSSVLGYFSYFALHHRVGPVQANVVTYLSPLVGLAIGTGLYGEPVTTFELGGIVIVFGGVTLVLWEAGLRARRSSVRPSEAPRPIDRNPGRP